MPWKLKTTQQRNYYIKGPVSDAEYQIQKLLAKKYKRLLDELILVPNKTGGWSIELAVYYKQFFKKLKADETSKSNGGGKVQRRRNKKGPS